VEAYESSRENDSGTAVAKAQQVAQAREESGQSGQAPAADRAGIRQQNARAGGKQAGAGQNFSQKVQNFRLEFGPGKKDILNFTNQLAVMVRAGISLQDSLESIAGQMQNKRFKAVITDVKDRIEAGQSFSEALAVHSDVFSDIYINMVAAAEVSGALSDMLQKLTEYMGAENETNSQVKGAMVYPIIIAVMAVVVTIFLLTFVLPRFTKIFAGKEHLLPGPTKALMEASVLLRSYWFLIVPAVGAVIVGFLYFIRTGLGRVWWDKTKLRLPLIKTLCKSLYITRSLHTMGVLIRAGVPILDTISITARITGNELYRNMWLGVSEDVRQGNKITASLGQYNLMPEHVVQMIRSGEDSGTLADVLRDVSDYYGRELKTVIKTTISMIEPIMIIVMGILVGFIAMSIVLPIFKMSSAVTG
jgi:type IV pilus assembly protein PilC